MFESRRKSLLVNRNTDTDTIETIPCHGHTVTHGSLTKTPRASNDSSHTGNALVEEAWMPIFKMHDLGTQPTQEQFEASFGEYILATCECIVHELI